MQNFKTLYCIDLCENILRKKIIFRALVFSVLRKIYFYFFKIEKLSLMGIKQTNKKFFYQQIIFDIRCLAKKN